MIVNKAGIVGWPVEHSLSPRLHSYWLNLYKIEGSYERLAVEPKNLGKTLSELASKGFSGVNLTIPHKESALSLVASLDPVAKRVGAINTIVVEQNGSLKGLNTDVYGFTQNLQSSEFIPSQRPVILLGAGGAARSALVALLDMGVSHIRLANRTPERAHKLAQEFGSALKVLSWNDSDLLRDASLLVNATSQGMKGQHPLKLNLDLLPSDAIVTDMIYTPLMTDLLIRASERGHRTLDGLGMLLHQARPAFKAFFGKDPDVTAALRSYVLEGLQ